VFCLGSMLKQGSRLGTSIPRLPHYSGPCVALGKVRIGGGKLVLPNWLVFPADQSIQKIVTIVLINRWAFTRLVARKL
jgi:hypothetical protein